MYRYTPEDDVRMTEEALSARLSEARARGREEGRAAAWKEIKNLLDLPEILEARCQHEEALASLRAGHWGRLLIVRVNEWYRLQQEVQELRRALSAYAPCPEDTPEE